MDSLIRKALQIIINAKNKNKEIYEDSLGYFGADVCCIDKHDFPYLWIEKERITFISRYSSAKIPESTGFESVIAALRIYYPRAFNVWKYGKLE